jgi:predicted phosphoribosyltransferase
MTPETPALYPSRSGAGALLGRRVYKRVRPPVLVVGVTPGGVEVAASAAKALQCHFDVVIAVHVRMEGGLGIVGAVAEDADAVLDSAFQPRFGVLEALDDAIDRARRAIKSERLLFRGHRPMRSVEGMHVVVVEGLMTSPWKALAAVEALRGHRPEGIAVAAAVSTQSVQESLLARRIEFICPTILLDPTGHPRPFGDPQDPSAERLRSIIIARDAA